MSDKSKTPARGVAVPGLSRRGFLKSAACAAGPLILSSAIMGRAGAIPPSEQLRVGCIGLGAMGTGNLGSLLGFQQVRVVAACDVDTKRRDEAINTINTHYNATDCKGYNAFEEMLDTENLDIVSIAVPDHWHSIPAIAAARRGLDIYAEKPLALTIAEGRAMSDAVARYGTVWQTGSWQRSQTDFRKACELVRNGRIGAVHTVEVGLPTGGGTDIQPEMPIPDGFDYNRWLGPAPAAPYTEQRCHWNFRWILDYSGGQLTDWAAHHVDIANWAMGTEYTGPVEVSGEGEFPKEGLWNTAVNYVVTAKYAAGASPVSPDGFTMILSNRYPNGAKFIGEKGELFITRGEFKTNPENIKTSVIGPNEIHLYESENHMGNFLECVRSRAKTITPIEVAHRAISVAHLGNIAMALGRTLAWDPVVERFVNDPEADRKLARAMRGPWRL